MYQANGIDLSSSQYKELLALYELAQTQEDVDHAFHRLHPNGNKYLFDDVDATRTYLALYEHGLIKGYKVRGFANYKGISQLGIDFIEDLAKISEASAREKRLDRRSGIIGAVSGAVGGALVTGAFQLVLMLAS